VPDQLGEAQIAPLLATGELGRKIHAFDELESTNDEAHRIAELGRLHGEVVWPISRPRAAAGAAAPGLRRGEGRDHVRGPCVRRCRRRERRRSRWWPRSRWSRRHASWARMGRGSSGPTTSNVKGRKIAGLLTELRTEADRVRHAVLGVGFNVSLQLSDFPEEPSCQGYQPPGRDRRAAGATPGVRAPARAPGGMAQPARDRGLRTGRRSLRGLSSTLGHRVRISSDGEAVEGDAVDLADDGALLVRAAGGVLVRIVAGDVEQLQGLVGTHG